MVQGPGGLGKDRICACFGQRIRILCVAKLTAQAGPLRALALKSALISIDFKCHKCLKINVFTLRNQKPNQGGTRDT